MASEVVKHSQGSDQKTKSTDIYIADTDPSTDTEHRDRHKDTDTDPSTDRHTQTQAQTKNQQTVQSEACCREEADGEPQNQQTEQS